MKKNSRASSICYVDRLDSSHLHLHLHHLRIDRTRTTISKTRGRRECPLFSSPLPHRRRGTSDDGKNENLADYKFSLLVVRSSSPSTDWRICSLASIPRICLFFLVT